MGGRTTFGFSWDDFSEAFYLMMGRPFRFSALCFLFCLHWEEYGMEEGENRDWYIYYTREIFVSFVRALIIHRLL